MDTRQSTDSRFRAIALPNQHEADNVYYPQEAHATHAHTDTDTRTSVRHARQMMFLHPGTAPHHHTEYTQAQASQEAGRGGGVRAQIVRDG